MRRLLLFLVVAVAAINAGAQQEYRVMIDLEVPGDSVPDPIAAGGSFPYGITTDGMRLVYIDYDTSGVFAVQDGAVLRLCTADVPYPRGLVFFENEFFVMSRGRLYRLDIGTGATDIMQDFRVSDESRPTGIAMHGAKIYISDQVDQEIRVYQRSDFAHLKTIPVQGNLREIFFFNGVLWVLDSGQRLVYGFDPLSGQKRSSFFAPAASTLRGMTVYNGLWWFTDKQTNTIIPTAVEFLPKAIRSNPRLVTIAFTDTMENHYPVELTLLDCRMAIPFTTLRQEIFQLKITRPERIVTDVYGQKIACYTFESVEPTAVRHIGFEAVVRLWDVRYIVSDLPLDDLRGVDAELWELYTADHEKLAQSDPLIQEALGEISVERNSLVRTLWNIRSYIHDHLEYARDDEHDPAPLVLSRGTGSCSEYSFLFLSMARALGIPSRFAGGSSGKYADEQGVYVDKIFHRWVEVFFPGFGWVPVDANRDDSEGGEYSSRLFLAYDWKVFQMSSRFLDDGEFLKNNLAVYHRWSRKEKAEGKVAIQTQVEWRLTPGYY